MRFRNLFFGALAALALFFQSCTTTTGNDDSNLDLDNMTPEEFERLPLSIKELLFTNFWLAVFYVNADKELFDYDYYYQQGTSNGYAAERYDFPDVSYMYSTLSDNYTNYFSPTIAYAIMNRLIYSEEQAGIGVDFSEIPRNDCTGITFCNDSTILIFKHVYPGGPADKAGIKKGDTLYTINGMVPRNEDQYRKIENVFGIGEQIPFAIKRGEEIIQISVTFDTFFTPTVFVDEEDGIPVITITEFSDTTYLASGTYGEFVEALKQTKDAEATIIDLRGNPGGSTDHCINMTAELLPKNDTVITMITHDIDSLTEMAYIDTSTYIAKEDGIGAGRYYVILADSGSASCAELMIAGTVSSTKSPIVGLTTYGKGIGQYYFMTLAEGLTGVTSMRILDKNGRTYHKYGIVPDFEEPDADKAMAKAVELAHEKKAVRTQGYGTTDLGHFTLAKSRSGKVLERGGAYKVFRDPHKILQKAVPSR